MRPVPSALLSRVRRRSRIVRAFPLAVVALLIPSSALAVERVETPFASTSPQSDVTQSIVKIKVPLPATAAAHPEACDWLQYLRWRSADGPTSSMDADAVVALMPGILEGASAYDVLARNAIRAAARRGRHIEVWGWIVARTASRTAPDCGRTSRTATSPSSSTTTGTASRSTARCSRALTATTACSRTSAWRRPCATTTRCSRTSCRASRGASRT